MTASTTPLLAVEDVEVAYGKLRTLTGVSLAVGSGEAVAVLGANGAGKSTLAKTISGMVLPSEGRVVFDGRDVSRWKPHRRVRAGIVHVPEGRGIFPGLSVLDNLRMSVRHAVTRRSRRDAIERAYEHFPILSERQRQQAGTMSGGEQRMLALARVLAVPPKLVVADELSLGLAPRLIDVIFDALRAARSEGVTVVVVEQYVDRALEFAQQAVVLRRGKVAWEGPSEAARGAVSDQYLGEGRGGSE